MAGSSSVLENIHGRRLTTSLVRLLTSILVSTIKHHIILCFFLYQKLNYSVAELARRGSIPGPREISV